MPDVSVQSSLGEANNLGLSNNEHIKRTRIVEKYELASEHNSKYSNSTVMKKSQVAALQYNLYWYKRQSIQHIEAQVTALPNAFHTLTGAQS